MTAGSYMTLITWKREGGKKSASSVFEGFLIADKQPKFRRTNAAHICPRCCLAVRDAKPGGSACGTHLDPLLRASLASTVQGDGVFPCRVSLVGLT